MIDPRSTGRRAAQRQLRAVFCTLVTLPLMVGLFAMQGDQGTAIDHVILGISDLERGIREFESRTGVSPKRGGEHPGRGTQNALVALDRGRYLEILAPSASQSSARPREAAISHRELTVVGWALHTPKIADAVQRVRRAGFEVQGPMPGSRRAPDGALLAWQSASVDELGVTPFFIEWSADTPHPSTTSPAGCTLVNMTVEHPTPARLTLLFETLAFRATVLQGERPAMQLTLDCSRGRVQFRS